MRLLSLFAFTLLYGGINAEYLRGTKPNVIIILADDQGYGDLSVYGNPILKTPNLDRLCQESVSFSQFHVAPMCTPTRGMLLTGVDAFYNGATGVASGMTTLRKDLPMAPQFFKQNGYRTALFGKWHLGDTYPYRPQDRGFDDVLSFNGSMIPLIANKMNDSYFNPHLLKNGNWIKHDGYITDIFFDAAMSWMKKQNQERKPFFLFLPTPTPHFPNQVANKYAKPYKNRSHKGKEVPANFYGMIANLDENMGRLNTFLEDQNLHKNTILIYLSDNGTQSHQAYQIHNAGMRGKKISPYDGGHKVPLFIRWPAGKLMHGQVIKQLATVQDILPTLIDFCKLKTENLAFDGISIVSTLRDKNKKIPERTIINQYVVVWKDPSGKKWDHCSVMRGPWRMLSATELYNIHEDPTQKNNIFSQRPEIAQQLHEDYNNWYKEAIKRHQKIQWLEAGGQAPNPAQFTAIDWMGTCTDTWKHAHSQLNSKGYYNIQINESGAYQISMRHWPEGSHLRLSPKFAKARLRIQQAREGKFDNANTAIPFYEKTLLLNERQSAKFDVNLPKGHYEFAADFLTAEDQFHKSALHLIIKKLD